MCAQIADFVDVLSNLIKDVRRRSQLKQYRTHLRGCPSGIVGAPLLVWSPRLLVAARRF